jgi:predicted nucleotidyltransferase
LRRIKEAFMQRQDIETLVERGFLSTNERQALNQLIAELKASWQRVKVMLFGSKVKGTADKESDIDILILLPCEVTEDLRRQIIHKVFDVNLLYETNISALIMSENEWESDKFSFLPIHSIIEEEGVPLYE